MSDPAQICLLLATVALLFYGWALVMIGAFERLVLP